MEIHWEGDLPAVSILLMSTEMTYDELLQRVRSLMTTTAHIPVVAISGHGGAGKSTLAEALAADLGLTEDQVVPTDCFYATTCGPAAGMWEQHDWRLIASLVRGARSEPRPERLRFDYRWWTGETGVEDHPMPPVLIVEGIRLLSARTRGLFDLTVWIDMDPGSAGARAKTRNLLQGDDQDELHLWDTKWIPEGHAYADAERPEAHADVVLPAGAVPHERVR
ncbi:hypothetical protein EXE58_03675 [Nocardioides seonyuensis]|uniref:Uridine kinase n=1 Tax=Nocardioides seonyuensis TaxID=2518371 RepID=A0A4V1BM01_9ACTN|nr:hypothetical protein [Nocardioides seonyuensis]QBX54652.1 hypothetical protein EXE58_03675 [Nocardioides seonyuensis]